MAKSDYFFYAICVLIGMVVLIATVVVLLLAYSHIRGRAIRLELDVNEQYASDLAKQMKTLLFKTEYQTSKSRSLRGIVHDLNNALFNVSGRIYILQNDTTVDEKHKKVLSGAELALNSCASLSREFLREGIEGSILLEMNTFVEELITEFNTVENVEWEFIGHYEPVIIEIPRVMLYRTLSNILKNCVEALDGIPSPKIVVEIVPTDHNVRITIRDNGPGMTREQLDQLSLGFSTKGLGHGIGMRIVKELLSFYGATLNIDSTLGVGTLFTLKIKAAKKSLSGAHHVLSDQGSLQW